MDTNDECPAVRVSLPEAERLDRQLRATFRDPKSYQGRVLPPHIATLLNIDERGRRGVAPRGEGWNKGDP